MKSENFFVHIAGVAMLALLAALFVKVYGMMQSNWLLYGLKIDAKSLPAPTLFFSDYSFLGYFLPISAFIIAPFAGKNCRQNRSPYIHGFLWLIGIAALAWLLASILTWQLPLYYPAATIE